MLLLGSRLVGWKVRVPSVQICLECGTVVVVVVVVVVGGGEDCTVLCLYPAGWDWDSYPSLHPNNVQTAQNFANFVCFLNVGQ